MKLLFNGRIGITDSTNPQKTAIAIQNDRIIAVGSDEEILNLNSADTQKENLGGRTVWPGLTDSHLHLELLGEKLVSVDCSTPTRDECLARVEDKAKSHPREDGWIKGNGWNQNLWQGGFGSAAELDAVSHGHPVLLYDQSLHSAWVNSIALRLAGINASTPDPVGGIIKRTVNGEPTGILHESAVSLVEKVIPPPSNATQEFQMKAAQTYLHSFGITTVNDFDTFTSLLILTRLRERGALQLRVIKGIPKEQFDWAIENNIQTGTGDDHIRWGWVKFFADGALGPQTAAMLRPYETDSSNYGKLMLESGDVLEHGIRASKHGLALAIHAIGDRAVREVLRGYTQLREYEKRIKIIPGPHRIEHLQVIAPEDLALIAKLNLVASMQPIHLLTDKPTADKQWGERSRYAYAFRSILDAGANLILGSDAPVESPNPFIAIHTAVTRNCTGIDGSHKPWYPAERIALVEAIKGYIFSPAQLFGFSSDRLNPGDLADIIILDKDPLQVDLDELGSILPERVMFAGQWTI
jgi:predicted amidohydrolase YtcJ